MVPGIGTAVFLALIGAAVGSFLNVIIDRLPARQSLIRPPSHCPNCDTLLRPHDNIPLFSYLSLGGKCRYCRAPIPRRVLVVEGVTTVIFSAIGYRFGVSLESGIFLFYAAFLITVIVIDLEQQLILNEILLAAIPVAVFAAIYLPGGPTVVSSLLGMLVGGGLMVVIFVLARGGMGGGDVKLVAVIGLMTGIPGVILAVFLSIVSGGVVATGLLVARRRGRRDAIPFGPFLAFGAAGVLLWGNQLVTWYLGLLGYSQ